MTSNVKKPTSTVPSLPNVNNLVSNSGAGNNTNNGFMRPLSVENIQKVNSANYGNFNSPNSSIKSTSQNDKPHLNSQSQLTIDPNSSIKKVKNFLTDKIQVSN